MFNYTILYHMCIKSTIISQTVYLCIRIHIHLCTFSCSRVSCCDDHCFSASSTQSTNPPCPICPNFCLISEMSNWRLPKSVWAVWRLQDDATCVMDLLEKNSIKSESQNIPEFSRNKEMLNHVIAINSAINCRSAWLHHRIHVDLCTRVCSHLFDGGSCRTCSHITRSAQHISGGHIAAQNTAHLWSCRPNGQAQWWSCPPWTNDAWCKRTRWMRLNLLVTS